jgi:hypothetical protein
MDVSIPHFSNNMFCRVNIMMVLFSQKGRYELTATTTGTSTIFNSPLIYNIWAASQHEKIRPVPNNTQAG